MALFFSIIQVTLWMAIAYGVGHLGIKSGHFGPNLPITLVIAVVWFQAIKAKTIMNVFVIEYLKDPDKMEKMMREERKKNGGN